MNSGLRRLAGVGLIIIALAGLLLGGFGIRQLWIWRLPATQAVQDNLAVASNMLKTTGDLLVLVEDSLQTANTEVDILIDTLTNLNRMLTDTHPLLTSLQALTGESLPGTLKTTQASLNTAQGSADIIDNLLRLVSSIPFFPGEPYNPKVPLSASLKEISTSLDSISPALANIDSSLATTQDNLSAVSTDIIHIIASTRQVKQNLQKAQSSVQEYQGTFRSAQTRLDAAQQAAPLWIERLVWLGTLVIAMIILAPLSLLLQGINLIKG